MPALLTEVFRHFIKVVLAAAIRLPGLHVTVAYQKVRVNMLGVRMHSEQYFITFAVNEMLREILRDLECQLIIQLPVVIEMKRDRHFVRKYCVRFQLAV